jgi:hypothetical protein
VTYDSERKCSTCGTRSEWSALCEKCEASEFGFKRGYRRGFIDGAKRMAELVVLNLNELKKDTDVTS